MNCFFVTDLHGKPDRYRKLFQIILDEKPEVVLFGGDLLPHHMKQVEDYTDFVNDFLINDLKELKFKMNDNYPDILMILGNDDARSQESIFIEAEKEGLIYYLNERMKVINGFNFYGYSFIPPSPFQLKDWEKYDVSRYVDPGCIHPTEGFRTVKPDYDVEYSTIQKDLLKLTAGKDLQHAVFLFHAPPYKCNLDRAALDNQMFDHVPLDVHVGSIAVKRFIEERQPLLTLHGHIHESTSLTGIWKEQFGRTWSMNGAHHSNELALIKFDTNSPGAATRVLT